MTLKFDFAKFIEKRGKLIGLFLTIILAFIVLCVFFGCILLHPSQYCFAINGDGFQSYFNTIYHIKYDHSFSYSFSQNYPYGDQVLFTNNQVPLSTFLKLINDNIYPISFLQIIGIVNLAMIFSVVISAAFIYLIFAKLNVNIVVSAIAAVAIAYLSPMIWRFPGHFSLSYHFVIPITIYLILLFDENKNKWISWIIALFSFTMACFHMYNFVFISLIVACYFIWETICDYSKTKLTKRLLHLSVQVLVPYIVLLTWIYFTDDAINRTNNPWGFFVCKSGISGVFFPDNDFINSTIKNTFSMPNVEWEGWSYIGHFATFMYFIIFGIFSIIPFFGSISIISILVLAIICLGLFKLINKKWYTIHLTDNNIVNFLLFTAFVSLIISFAWPFVLDKDMLKYMGPLKQFRGIGRFSWIFFYIINIIGFYCISTKLKNKILRNAILITALTVVSYDSYKNIKSISSFLENESAELLDDNNISENNSWLKNIKPSDYQAIMPLPYFHIGSESFGVAPKDNIDYYAYIASIKTGLPVNASISSRTSINQSYNCWQLAIEPYRFPEVINSYHSKKPLLLMVLKNSTLSKSENNLISKSSLLCSTSIINFYNLPYIELSKLAENLYNESLKIYSNTRLFAKEKFEVLDSSDNIVFNDFEQIKSNVSYQGKGALSGDVSKYIQVCNYIINKNSTNSKANYVVSFWVNSILKDLIPRTQVIIDLSNSDSTKNISTQYTDIARNINTIDKEWGLFEYTINDVEPNSKLKIVVQNQDIKPKNYIYIDNLLIRKESNNVYQKNKNSLFYNNMIYIKTN
ncbi:MAG: hypothetical protein WCK02_09550 [Bacteroidota bacterium]